MVHSNPNNNSTIQQATTKTPRQKDNVAKEAKKEGFLVFFLCCHHRNYSQHTKHGHHNRHCTAQAAPTFAELHFSLATQQHTKLKMKAKIAIWRLAATRLQHNLRQMPRKQITVRQANAKPCGKCAPDTRKKSHQNKRKLSTLRNVMGKSRKPRTNKHTHNTHTHTRFARSC